MCRRALNVNVSVETVVLANSIHAVHKVTGVYENTARVSAPDAPGDSDRSHYAGSVTAVPEPETLALFAMGVAAILALRRRNSFVTDYRLLRPR